MKITKGDTVQVITGSDAGKTGRVIKVFPDKNNIVVEGISVVKRHVRPTQDNPQGGIIEKEATIHISNVMLENNLMEGKNRVLKLILKVIYKGL